MAQHTTAAFQLITRIDSLHSPRDIPLHTNIVFICSCRDCVVPLTHAFQVSWLARYALHAMACARLPGSTRLKTSQIAALAALKDRIVFGITVPALSCSNTSARSGMAPLDLFRALPFSVIHFFKIAVRSERLCILVTGLLDAFVTAFNLRSTHRGPGLSFRELMYGRIKMMTALRPALAHTFQTVCLGHNPDQRRPEAFWLPKPKKVLHVANLPRYN